DRGVAVGVREGLRHDSAGQPVDLGQDVTGGVLVEVLEGTGAHDLLAVEHLEQVELEVPEVALVMRHARAPLCHYRCSHTAIYRLVTNQCYYSVVAGCQGDGGTTL